MSAPHLLLVDDSQAILAYETAVLGGHYLISTATHGREGLRLAREILPSVVLLDLSMPEMDGLTVIAHMKADPALAGIPVIVISTERDRADDCLRAGAADFVEKPIRAEVLRSVVARVMADAQREADEGSLGILCVEVAGMPAALSLDGVVAVVLQPATFALSTGCAFLHEAFEFRGESVAVLDLARFLEKEHAADLLDRKLVIGEHVPGAIDPAEVAGQKCRLAVCVDEVREPEVVPRGAFLGDAPSPAPAEDAFPREIQRVDRLVTAPRVRTARGVVPLILPRALVPVDVLGRLSETVGIAVGRRAGVRP